MTIKLNKYWQITKTTISSTMVYFWDFIAKNIFFVFIMFIYLMLWTAIYSKKGGDSLGGLTLNGMIWYLVVTELVTLSRSNVFNQINEDVKGGAIAYQLNKPYSYILYCLSTSVGDIAVKLFTNSIAGIAVGLVFVGALEGFKLISLPFIILSLVAGCLLHFLIYMCLALTSFWIEENSAFFWIYSKLVFTLGGMLLPIDMFPLWLQKISAYLPFAYVTYTPARLTVDFSVSRFIQGFSIQLLYIAVFAIISALVYRRGVRNVNVNGG
jgi:ABC-2 type transport system permease protein